MTDTELLAALVVATPAVWGGVLAIAPRRLAGGFAMVGAVVTSGLALALAVPELLHPSHRTVTNWVTLDAAAALILVVIAAVGLASVLLSPAYLSGRAGHDTRSARFYYVAVFAFWATLLAVPLAGNLAAAWILVEATTATSAMLVGFSGKPRALEAGWKYLILTSLGLGVALLGIVLLAAGIPGHGLGSLSWRALSTYVRGEQTALVAYVLVLAGLAAKIGWAPVHNWLPDAHSEAPPTVSALLSSALLPAVLLIAWRCQQSLAPVIGTRTGQDVLIAFGLLSLGVAAPFLSRPLAWKRLLAYSSLEHIGAIALGVAFGSPLALAGVAIHICGHAIAKALGFYAATPLLGHEPRSAGHAVTGIGRTQPQLGATLGISLAALAGMPPSPLFVSEVLIVAGGVQAGRAWVAAAAALLLALGFLGIAHALLETVVGKAHRRDESTIPGLREVTALACISVVLLLTLSAAALWLPGSGLVDALAKGAS